MLLVAMSFMVGFTARLDAQYTNFRFEPGSSIQTVGLIPHVISDNELSFLEYRQSETSFDLGIRNILFPDISPEPAYVEISNDWFFISHTGSHRSGDRNVVVGWRPFGAALNVYDDEMNELLSFFEPAASNEIREITDAISLNDGGFLCAGIVAYYLDDVIGVDDVQLRLWRLDENAEPMWAFNLPELGWTASPSEILLNPNGEFIVFANRYIGNNNYRHRVVRFSPEGDVLQEQEWGTDWANLNPRAVVVNDTLAYLASFDVYAQDDPFGDVRHSTLGLYQMNLNTLEITPLPSITDSYTNAYAVGIFPISSGYAIPMNYWNYEGQETVATRIIWLDENFEIVANKYYQFRYPEPALNWDHCDLWYLVEHENGWFSTTGHAREDQYVQLGTTSWVMHLDPCGDVVYSGCALSTYERPSEPSAMAWPNPVRAGERCVVTGNWIKGQRIALLDMQGREVQARIAPADDMQLEFDLTGVTAGVYFVAGLRVVVE
jgi:hypothetical protein